MSSVLFVLVVLMFYPSGKFEREMRPVEVPACGAVEDSTCGIKKCMAIGRERAAQIWGVIPGMNFGIMCHKPDGSEAAKEGTEAGGGHPALNFQ